MTRVDADVALDARVDAGRSVYRFRTVDGVCSPDAVRPPELLLVESLWDDAAGRLLCPGANYGLVGTVLADAPGVDAVALAETSARCAGCCRRNLARNRGARSTDAAVAVTDDPAAPPGDFDAAAYAPRPDAPLSMACRRAGRALAALDPGGRLFLAASKRTGLARFERFLARHAGRVVRRGSRGDHRLLVATRPAEFEAPTPVTPRRLTPTVDGVDLSLVAVPGLFAAGGLDAGTRLLAETATVADGDRVLDACCGYGALGAWAGRRADIDLWLTDDDRVATRCAAAGLRASGVDGTVVTADAPAGIADRRFDRILCNPPTHAGDGALADLFDGLRGTLAPDGALTLVTHEALDPGRHLRGFRSVERVAAGAEHVVRRARP